MDYVQAVLEAVWLEIVGPHSNVQREPHHIQTLTCKSKAILATAKLATSGNMEDQRKENFLTINNSTNER